MLRLDAGRAGLVDKVKPLVPGSHVRSRLLVSSVVPGRVTHAPFSSARRANVRVSAADDGSSRTYYAPGYDPNAPRKQRAPRVPRVEKTVTVQLEDLKPGQELDGQVKRVEPFGAFVDFGARSDGLLHISQLQKAGYKGGDLKGDFPEGSRLQVNILSVDLAQNRIALGIKRLPSAAGAAPSNADDEADEDDEEEYEEAGDEELAVDGDKGPIELADDDDDEEDEEVEDEGMADIEAFDIPDGTDLVFPDELPEAFFIVPEAEIDSQGLTAEGLADYETNEEEYQYEFEHHDDAVPLPLYEQVSGKVTRVTEYGAFVAFAGPDGRQLEGLLHISEMKAPASILTEEELAEYDPEEEEEDETVGLYDDYAHNEYVDVGEISDATQIYKVGDAIECFFIGISAVDEEGKGGGINLSQFTDAELLGASVEVSTPDEEEEVLDDGEFEVDDEMAEDFEDESLAAMDPVRILEEDDEAEPTAAELAAIISGGERRGRRGRDDEEEEEEGPIDEDALAGNAETHQKGNLLVASSILRGSNGPVFLGQLPSRPMRRGDGIEMPDLSSLMRQEQDFELDISDLQDYWTDSLLVEVPKNSMRKAGFKLQIGEDGSVQEVPRQLEDGKDEVVSDDVYDDFSLAGDLNERAQAFYDDLMDDEDEAELPAYAYRSPVA